MKVDKSRFRTTVLQIIFNDQNVLYNGFSMSPVSFSGRRGSLSASADSIDAAASRFTQGPAVSSAQ
jgi:hypothetical protein